MKEREDQMTIETLTEEERTFLSEGIASYHDAKKALRIIDSQAVALAESRAECERLREELAGKAGYNVWMRAAKELGAKLDAAESKLAAAVALLARAQDASPKTPREANHDSVQLDYDIGQFLQREGFTWDAINRVWRRLTSAQPAAPARSEDGPDHGEADPDYPPHREHFAKPDIDPRSVCGVVRQFLDDPSKPTSWLAEALRKEGLCVAPARTEAEQRVLDAMGRIDEMLLQMTAENDEGDDPWVMPAIAEIERRRLKP
jgi:hypothetical protein